MTDPRSRLRARREGRRGHLAAVRHVAPAEAVTEAQRPADLTEPITAVPQWPHRPLDNPGPGDQPWHCEHCGGPCQEAQEAAADVSRETSLEPAPPLRAAQVARLEALTALWTREVRLDAPADATLVYSAPRPPVPPSSRASSPPAEDRPPVPATAEEEAAVEAALLTPAPTPDPGPAVDPVSGPARRVSDWVSRHDERSRAYAVRERLARRVPITDRLLERGPVLDQGTVPPLDLRTASACTGMAAVAAANVLRLGTAPAYTRAADVELLDVSDARDVYFRAQELDEVHGHDYAGTSVLAVMRAGQEAGWWDAYFWGLGGTADIAQVILQWGVAVVVGVPWGPSLEAPDAAGVIAPTSLDGSGHALAVVGLRRQLRDGRPGPWFILQQSRGTAEGDGGLVYLHHADLARMLAGVGEAAVPVDRWTLQGLGL